MIYFSIKNKTLFLSKNRYKVLQPQYSANEVLVEKSQLTAIEKIPPIFVRGLEDFPTLCTELFERIRVDNFYCK